MYCRKRFWTTTRSRRTNLHSLQQFKEFGILFSRIETWHCRKYKEAREWNETRTAKFVNTCTTLPKWRCILKSYWWNLFSQWFDGLSETSDFGSASGKFSWLYGISKLEIQFQNWSMFETSRCSSHNAQGQRSWNSKVNWRNYENAIDCGAKRFPRHKLDAMIASASKRLPDKHVHFRKRVSVEEQRAQKYGRFLRGRHVADMIYEHFRATRSYEAVQGLTELMRKRWQNDDVQDIDIRWDQALFSASDVPSDVVLEGLCKTQKKQATEHLQTVMALYDQETVRNNGQTKFFTIEDVCKTSYRSGDENVETSESGANLWKEEQSPRVKKGKKAYVDRKVGECFQWKAHGKCWKGDSCCFSHDKLVQEDLYGGQSRTSTVVFSRTKLEGQDWRRGEKNPQKHHATERKALQTKGSEIPCLYKNCKEKTVM